MLAGLATCPMVRLRCDKLVTKSSSGIRFSIRASRFEGAISRTEKANAARQIDELRSLLIVPTKKGGFVSRINLSKI
jgi:hypothetical protein